MRGKPRLLIAMDTFYPMTDGVIRFINEVVPRIHEHYNITLLVPDFKTKKTFLEELIRVVKLPAYKKFGLAGYPTIKLSWKNKRIIGEEVRKADIIWVQDLALIGLITLRYAHKFNKRSACFVHQILWEQFSKVVPKFLENVAFAWSQKVVVKRFNRCDLLMVPYNELIDQLRFLPIKTDMEETRLGVNIDTFIPHQSKDAAKEAINIKPQYTVIGYVGRLSKEKNVEVLLKSFLSIQKNFRRVFLLIVGDGLKSIVEKFKGEKNVRVTGFVGDVIPYLQAMDIFVMPSLTETTSLATLEAMSCGLPVITTRVGFMQEYVIKGHNGLTFPKGNQTTLTILLKKLLADKKLREEMGVRGRHMAHAFSWDKTAERVVDVLGNS